MSRRVVSALGVAGLAAAMLTVVAPGAASGSVHPFVETNVCGPSPVPPCVVAMTRNGADERFSSSYFVSPGETDSGAGHGMLFQLFPSSGTLSTADTWSITVQVAFDPREADGYAGNMTVTRTDNGDGTWNVTYTGNPVVMGDNAQCNQSSWPWTCPTTTDADQVNFLGEASDYQFWSDASQWDIFNGMTMSTNIEATGLPPQIDATTFALVIDLANSHFMADGTTVFHGFFHLSLPNAYLEAMGIDDPSTLVPSGVSAGAGTGTVTVTPGATATQIDIDGMTFSPRKLRVSRGVITPTRPTHLATHRLSAHRGKVTFHKSRARGSHLRYYQARCTALHHPTRTARSNGTVTRITVKHLAAHTSYQCRVRAKAKAGYGRWSKSKRLKA